MKHTYTVIGKQMVSPTTLLVTLHGRSRSDVASYQPGQYMSISFKRLGRYMPSRCFSIVNSPLDQDYLQFAMRVRGAFTTSAKSIKIGDTAEVYGPFGHFIYNMEQDRSTVFIAGGIGITPFVSMIRHASRLQLQNNITLLYSCHNQDDVPFAAELLAYQRQNPRFRVLFVIDQGPMNKFQGAAAISGRITGDLLQSVTNGQPLTNNYFVCGPPAFMDSMVTMLDKFHVPESSIITEAFSQGHHTQRRMWQGWPAQVYGLTALSVIFSTVVIAAKDIAKTQLNKNVTLANGQTVPTQTNSRGQEVDATLQQLQTGTGDTSTTTPTTTTTTTPTPSGSTTPTGSTPTPTTKPGPSPSPTPTPTPTPTPKPSPSPTPTPTPPTPTPTPTPTPAPPPAPVGVTLTFSASSTSITAGQSVTLSWSTNGNATQPVNCSGGGAWSASGSSGSRSVSPSSTSTFTMSCSNSAGSSGTKSITVTVTPACVSTPSNPC